MDGYTLQVGARTQEVTPDADGKASAEFYINGKPGRLTITAKGQKGDGETHYFVVERTAVGEENTSEPFERRIVEVASGETYVIDNLPKGEFCVTEHTFSTGSDYKVTVSETENKPVTKYFTKANFTASGASNPRFLRVQAGGDYIDGFKCGAMYYTKNNKDYVCAADDTYDFYFGYLKESTGGAFSYWTRKGRKCNTRYSGDASLELKVNQERIIIAVANVTNKVSAKPVEKLKLEWVEHTEKEPVYTFKANEPELLNVDRRGLIKIEAPTGDGSEPEADKVRYTYEIEKLVLDDDGNPVLETDGSQKWAHAAAVELGLNEEQEVKVDGAGTYRIRETVAEDEAIGFKMEISGSAFGTTEVGKTFEITVKGDRMLTVKKPGSPADDNGREYQFVLTKKSDSAKIGEATLLAGEQTEILLTPGTYQVTPTNDKPQPFLLICSDTSQVQADFPDASPSEVAFTNVFTPGDYGYRYVHEYYLKKTSKGRNAETEYQYEGCSPVSTVKGRTNPEEIYNAIDVTKEPIYKDLDGREYEYNHLDRGDAYGYVVDSQQSSGTGGSAQKVRKSGSVQNTVGAAGSRQGSSIDEKGLRIKNTSTLKGSDGSATIRYEVDEDLMEQNYIGVDKTENQVIILRYYRELPEEQVGSFKYIHVYYRRDENGDTWEGTSELGELSGERDKTYTASVVDLETEPTNFNVDGRYYKYTHDNRPSYGKLTAQGGTGDVYEDSGTHLDGYTGSGYLYRPNSEGNHVTATKKGDEIIVLRYYRDVGKGNYNIVHEYYYREPLEGWGESKDPGLQEGEETGGESVAEKIEEQSETESLRQPESDGKQKSEQTEGGGRESPGQPEGGGEPIREPAQSEKGDSDGLESTGQSEGGKDEAVENGRPEDDSGKTTENTQSEDTGTIEDTQPGNGSETGKDVRPEDGGMNPDETQTDGDSSEKKSLEQIPEGSSETVESSGTSEASDKDNGIMALAGESDIAEEDLNGTVYVSGGYTYSFEGRREVRQLRGELGSLYFASDNDRLEKYAPPGGNSNTYRYEYSDVNFAGVAYGRLNEDGSYSYIPGKKGAAPTEEGRDIIILRYYRDANSRPVEPDKPVGPGEAGEPDKSASLGNQESEKQSLRAESAQSGDENLAGIWLLLCMSSAVCICLLSRKRLQK